MTKLAENREHKRQLKRLTWSDKWVIRRVCQRLFMAGFRASSVSGSPAPSVSQAAMLSRRRPLEHVELGFRRAAEKIALDGGQSLFEGHRPQPVFRIADAA
jgi:hypothetical protein